MSVMHVSSSQIQNTEVHSIELQGRRFGTSWPPTNEYSLHVNSYILGWPAHSGVGANLEQISSKKKITCFFKNCFFFMIDLRILGVSNPIFLIQSVCPSVMLGVSDSEMGWTEEFWSKTNSLKWQN